MSAEKAKAAKVVNANVAAAAAVARVATVMVALKARVWLLAKIMLPRNVLKAMI